MAGGAPGGLPLLDPVGALQLRDPPAVEAAARARSLGAALGGFRCVHGPRFPQLVREKGGWATVELFRGIILVSFGDFEGCMGPLGVSLGPFGAVFWDPSVSSWDHLGSVLCYLGADLGHFGAIRAILGPPGPPWGDHLGGSFGVISVQFVPFWGHLGSFGFACPRWCPFWGRAPFFFGICSTWGCPPPAVLAVRCPAPPAGTGGAAPVRTVGPLPAAAARVPPAPRRECPQCPPRVHTASPCCVRHVSLWVDLMALYAHRVAWVDLVAPRAQRG